MHYIFRFYQVELDIPLEEQGPFDLIIQKVPDYLGKAVGKELGKDEALQMLQGIKVSKGWSVRKVMGGGGGLCERLSVSKLGGFEGILPRENFKSKTANSNINL